MAFVAPVTVPRRAAGARRISRRARRSRRLPSLSLSSGEASAPARLRKALASEGLLLMPCCFDALSARLIERAGFALTFMSGFSVAASVGLPDTGLLSYGEAAGRLREITEATSVPVIADGDTGYGNAINVRRTVRGFAAAGAAGVMVEDQVSPKRCGHVRGKDVVPRDEALERVRAACDARDELGTGLVVVARTDAAAVLGIGEAIERARLFKEVGADILFVEGPRGRDELQRVGGEVEGHKLVNMLEGGMTPLLPKEELESLGFKIAAYPLTLVSAAIKAMENALEALKTGRPEKVLPLLKSFEETKEIAGFNAYHEMEERYGLQRTPLKVSDRI